jgi:hypothetical protein
VPRKKSTLAAATTIDDDYITFSDGRTMPVPEPENAPDWLLPARFRKQPGAATPIDAPRKGQRPTQLRTA